MPSFHFSHFNLSLTFTHTHWAIFCFYVCMNAQNFHCILLVHLHIVWKCCVCVSFESGFDSLSLSLYNIIPIFDVYCSNVHKIRVFYCIKWENCEANEIRASLVHFNILIVILPSLFYLILYFIPFQSISISICCTLCYIVHFVFSRCVSVCRKTVTISMCFGVS